MAAGAAVVVGAIALDMLINKKGFSNDLTGIKSMAQSAAKTIAGVFGTVSFVSFTKSCIEMGSNLEEVQNVVDVTFGAMTKDANAWAESAMTAFGMSEKVAKQYLGTTGAMSKAFGFSTQEALSQAKTLAGLAGDVASFYNLSTDEAYTKLKAVYTGETEGLKALGVVMTQSALDQFALAKGFSKTTAKMSEQEKVSLRLAFVTDKLSAASGDFVRTQDSWANQTRVLSLRFDALKATLGQGFINVLTPVVKWLNTLIEKLMLYAEVFKQFTAQVFGDAGETGEGDKVAASMTGAAEATENAQRAVSEYKKSLMGFDEINMLSSNSNTDANTAVSGDDYGLGSGIVSESMSETEEKAAKIVEKMKDWLGITGKITSWSDFFNTKIGKIAKKVGEIGLAFAGWKVGNALIDFITKTDWKSVGRNIAGVAGSFLALDGVSSTLKDGASWKSALETTSGGALLGYSIGGGAGAIVGGILGAAFSAISAIWQNKDVWLHWGWVEATTDALADALLWIEQAFTDTVSWIQQAFKDAIDWIVQAFKDAVDWIVTAWNNVGEFFKNLWDGIKSIFSAAVNWIVTAWSNIGEFFKNLWDGIKSIFSAAVDWLAGIFRPVIDAVSGVFMRIAQFAEGCWIIIRAVWKIVSDWFNNKVIKPIVKFFKQLFESISLFFSSLWEDIKSIWGAVADWFNNKVIKPIVNFFEQLFKNVSGFFKQLLEDIKAVWGAVSEWFDTNIIQPVVGLFESVWTSVSLFFSSLWEDIKSVWGAVADWFNYKVIKPIVKFFKNAWDSIVSAFKTAFSAIGSFLKSVFNGVIGAVEKVINFVIRAINGLIGGFNAVVSWAAGVIGTDWGGVTPLSEVSLPRLAQGGYVKANTPQLAIVGDNRHEGEIVAPESKIAEAVAKGMKGEENDDLPSLIYNAVYDAVSQALSTVNIAPDVIVQIGDEALDRFIVKSRRKHMARSGGKV